MTISEARAKLDAGDVTAVKLAQTYLDAIKKSNDDLNAYLEVFDDVLEQAKAADKKIEKGESGPLTGIPIGVKDNILIKGRTASAGSKILETYTATYDATVTKKLKDQGVVFLGRTNCDEFAMGSSTENSAYGVTKNPHDESRVPGGTSGGSAAAVAAELATVALGSDTGGSIRQPGSFCGVVGLKPTYGSVSRSGLMAQGSSLDVIGPLAQTVTDAETVFSAIKGHDTMDSTSVPNNLYPTVAEKKTLFMGVPRDFLKDLDPVIAASFDDALEKYARIGYEVVDVDLPHIRHALASYYVIMFAESSTNLSRFDGVKYGLHEEGATLLDDYVQTRASGFGAEVRRRILLGTYVLSAGYYDAYYGKATQARELIREDFNGAFGSVDVIAMPTTPTPAFKIGEKNDPLSMYLADIFTVPVSLAGNPGMSVPMGTTSVDGTELPLGIQLVADHLHEDRLFQAGKDFLDEK